MLALQKQVEDAKADAKQERLKRLAADLAELKKQDPKAFEALLAGVTP